LNKHAVSVFVFSSDYSSKRVYRLGGETSRGDVLESPLPIEKRVYLSKSAN
jgi:hypothetical protein